MAVAGLGTAPELPGRHVPGDPVEVPGGELPGKKGIVSAEDHPVMRWVNGLHIQRVVGGDPKAFPLAHGVVGNALVAAQDMTVFIHEVAGGILFSGVPPDEGGIISVEDLEKQVLDNLTKKKFILEKGEMTLIKAINNFNPELEVKFSTYAVPMIIGEIRRFIRDNN